MNSFSVTQLSWRWGKTTSLPVLLYLHKNGWCVCACACVSMQTLYGPCRLPKANKCYVREEKEQMEVPKDERQEEKEMSSHFTRLT